MRFEEGIKKAVGMKGKELLADSRALGAFLADLSPEDKKMISVVCHMSSDHIFDQLASCPADQNAYHIDVAASQMREYYSVSAAETVEKALRNALLADAGQQSAGNKQKPEATTTKPKPTTVKPDHIFSEEDFSENVLHPLMIRAVQPAGAFRFLYWIHHTSGKIVHIEVSREAGKTDLQVKTQYLAEGDTSTVEKKMGLQELVGFLQDIMVETGDVDQVLTDQEEIPEKKVPDNKGRTPAPGPVSTSVFVLGRSLNMYDILFIPLLAVYLLLFVDLELPVSSTGTLTKVMTVLLPVLICPKIRINEQYPRESHKIWRPVLNTVLYLLTLLYGIRYIGFLAGFKVVSALFGSGLFSMIAVVVFLTMILWLQMKRREEEPALRWTLFIMSGLMCFGLIVVWVIELIS